MRDDRYKGTAMPRQVRKLCRMSEREADRARPDRLSEQAVTAFVSQASTEISSEFRRQLCDHDAKPSFFGSSELARAAETGLEVAIANCIREGANPTQAVSSALRQRGEGYVREQKCQLIADRHPSATIASDSVKAAFDASAPIAAKLILTGQATPKANGRVQLTENLLAPPNGGAPV
jgi:hypothetical protein